MSKLGDEIDRLAAALPYGALQAATDPAGLIASACNRIAELERESAELRASMATVQAAAKTLVRGADMRAAEAYRKMPDAYEAIRTLDSEREANAILTAELEQARAKLAAVAKVEEELRSCARSADLACEDAIESCYTYAADLIAAALAKGEGT
jgi:small-conductance mechanosensitive channel